jgi:hypothetical protein
MVVLTILAIASQAQDFFIFSFFFFFFAMSHLDWSITPKKMKKKKNLEAAQNRSFYWMGLYFNPQLMYWKIICGPK